MKFPVQQIAEIDSLTACQETDALSLVFICGWRWRKQKVAGRCSLSPPLNDPTGWEPSPDYMSVGEEAKYCDIVDDHWPDDDERFSDWPRGCIKWNKRGHGFNPQMPSPSQSWDDMRMIVEAMTRNGWRWELGNPAIPKPCWGVKLSPVRENSAVEHWAYANELPLAICKAALKAISDER
jgi:hypothetical protein